MIDNSYYIILNRLKAFANGHYLINTFTYHEIANFDITKNPHYPIMHVVPVSMNPTKGAIDYSFNITFADWVRAKEEKQENEVTVISDLHRCALDLCAEITNGNILFGDEVSINGDAVIEPFIDEFANVLSGVTLQITIRVPYNWSACDIPANWVEGTGDIPDFGGRSLTMDIYDEGDFIVSAREMDFIGENVTVTYTGNRAIVTITGGGGGGVEGVTGNIVDNTDPLNPVVTQEQSNWNEGDNTQIEYIRNKPTIPTLTSDLTNDGEDGVNPFITALDIPAQVNSDWNATSGVEEILNKPDLSGFGDMFKSVYDTDDDGIVDKSETTQIIVRNSTGSTLTKGQVVYLSGATGNRPNAVLAQANSEATSSKTIGIVTANIANNSDGNIAVNGTLHDLNTSSFSAGDAVWLSATTAGGITATPPSEPNHTVFIGYIARAHPTQGRIVIAIQNGYELNELHGVLISSPTNNQGLIYNSTSGLWENQNIPSADWNILSLTETSARYDNYAPTGWVEQKVISINANYVDKVQVYSGISGGYAGRMVTIQNSSTDNLMILEQNSTNSSAANRLRFQGRSAYFLFPSDQITLLHNGTNWSVLSSNLKNGHMAFDDMLGSANQASPTTYFGETGIGVANGTGAIIRNDNMVNNGFGTITFTTGTVATNSGTIKAMARSGFFASSGTFDKYCVVSRIKLDQLPTAAQDFIFGVGISNGANGNGITTSGSMSWYASNGNAFWRNYSANTASTLITDTTTSLAVTTNVVVLGTYHPNNLGDCVFFYSSDGGMTYAVSSRFVRVSNNYGGSPVIGVNKLVGTTAISATVDYIGITCKGGVI